MQYMFVFLAHVRLWNYSVPVFLQHMKGFQGVLEKKNTKYLDKYCRINPNLSGFAILWDIHENNYHRYTATVTHAPDKKK